MKKKQIYNYIQEDGSMISYRNSMSEFAPKQAEFKKIKAKIEGTIEKETTPEFDDALDYLITLLRRKIFLQINFVSVTTAQKQLTKLTKHLTKLQAYLDSDSFDNTHRSMSYQIMKKMSDLDCEDPLFTLYTSIGIVTDICEETKKSIKGKKLDFTANSMRQILAEELARELDKMGIKLTKYRNSDFINILKAVLKMIPCKINGNRISISIPSNLTEIAYKAIDDFPHKEPYPLLSFE